MSQALSNWLNHIKSDDIDGGLAADFDGSFSGLGSELGSNPYNMSEALLALPPVFKQETFRARSDGTTDSNGGSSSAFAGYLLSGRSVPLPEPGRSSPTGSSTSSQSVGVSISSAHSLSLPNLQQHCADATSFINDTINTEWVSLMTSMNLGEVGDVDDSTESRFQYILNAATSPATRMSEETLTYLNQGQSYEMKLKRLKEGSDQDEQLLKSIVRVVFHERRLQYMEKEQLDIWKLTRPGERFVDIDIPLCRGLLDVKIDPHQLNCVEFVWDPRPQAETKVAVKIHCISTEFTAKKHGGEKGVPFRIQVETYTHSASATDHVPRLLHCASCQVKVFKPKGADRKHKTDREKIERRSASEKEKFQPSYECTVLTEIPLDQVHKYLELLNRQQDDDDRCGKDLSTETAVSIVSVTSLATSTSDATSVSLSSAVTDTEKTDVSQSPAADSRCVQAPITSPVASLNQTLSRKRHSESLSIPSSSSCQRLAANNMDTLLASATAEEVTVWLTSHRFANFLHTFQDFSGSDLLRLCREDLIQICGTADGIRLYNALQAKTVRPKLTLYVCQMSSVGQSKLSWHESASVGFSQAPVKLSSRSSTPSPTPLFSVDPVVFKATSQSSAAVRTDNTNTAVQESSVCTKSGGSELPRSNSVTTSAVEVLSSSRPPSSALSFAAVAVAVEKRETASQTCSAPKRQMPDSDDNADGDEVTAPLFVNKKQRIQNAELAQREVYHALYLDSMTEYHLCEKLACLYDILPTQILELYLQGPSGIHILVTDNVVQNFKDHSSFILETIPDGVNAALFRIVLRSIELHS